MKTNRIIDVPKAETFDMTEKSDNDASGVMISNIKSASTFLFPDANGVLSTNPRIAS